MKSAARLPRSRPAGRQRRAAAIAASPAADESLQVRRILVPVDFSAASRRAVCVAGQLAKAFGARLVLLHVTSSGRADRVKPVAARLQQFARRELPAGIPVATLVRPGDPCSNIVRAAICDHDIDLLVVAPHHSPSLPQSTHGRLAGRIALQAPCPVLILRGQLPPVWRRPSTAAIPIVPPDGRILVPLDFSFWAQRSLACGIVLARQLGLPLGVLHVSEIRARSSEFGIPHRAQFAADQWANGTRQLEVWSRRVPKGIPVRTMLRQGVGWREIVAEAEGSPTTVIVLGSSGSHSLPDFCRVGTEEMVLQFAPCPVLVIPPSGWSRVWACPVPDPTPAKS